MQVERCSRKLLKSIYLFLTLVTAFCFSTPNLFAAAGNSALKIYEVAGAGGLAGANYRQDTIILFNPTQAAITCKACAIQTHSGSSNTSAWTVYKLPSFTVPAGGYYMIAASSPTLATYGDLPPISYDYRLKTIEGTTASNDNILSSTTGTIALTNSQTALTSTTDTTCGSGSQLVDLVGYGSDIATDGSTAATTNICYAGSSYAYYDGSSSVGRKLGVTRKNKCIDAYDNWNDFVNVPVTYLNSSSTPTPCPPGAQLSATVSVTPNNPGVLESMTIQAAVTPAANSAGGAITALARLDMPYYSSSSVRLYDDGTNGDAKANDGIYTATTTVPSATISGFTYPLYVTVSDTAGNSYTGATRLSISNGAVTISAPSTSATVAPGDVWTIPLTLIGLHGYGGILAITCTGSPNTNSLGVPISTQCVSTPPQVTMGVNGTAKVSLAIAMGTTKSAAIVPKSLPFGIVGALSILVLTLGLWRKKRVLTSVLTACVLLFGVGATGCGKNAGLGNTGAAPGTYTYTVTVTDTTNATVTNSLTFTVTVK